MRYICPGIFISGTQANDSIPNWNYRWNVRDPEEVEEGLGVPHTVEVNAIWGPENVVGGAPESYYEGGVNAAIVPVVQGYWTSFIRSYNPNTYRVKGSPQWERWTAGDGYWNRLMFRTNQTMMEKVPEKQQERCGYLSSIGLSLKQ
jgi:carboxylesterase type B